ncbi:MAG: polysaccharide pyruvyl transferase family protein [Deltaproteobacteria bacterium]|nr:polysaccharide pyruvyl transferase family protein [Deltaproteobacteria bacterium]
MYIVLSGAKKNIGDFLITDRARKLLSHFRPEHEHVQLPSWENLEPHLEIINRSSAVIILGGPGFQPHFYPGVYKFVPDTSKIRVPIIPMGLGWKGEPGDFATIRNYNFTSDSMTLLKRISRESEFVSCRDYHTLEILKRNGIENALMTGCPVWYHLPSINRKFYPPEKIRKLVYTPAQKHLFRDQSIDMAAMLRKKFPESELFCCFHRGLNADDEFTPRSNEKNDNYIRNKVEKMGFTIVDGAWDLKNIDFYNTCDLHVGYRVHAHLHFISRRVPSLLIHEDGRGRGVSESLNLMGIDGFQRRFFSSLIEKVPVHEISRALRGVRDIIKADTLSVGRTSMFLDNELENGFKRYTGFPVIIDEHFNIMKKFINSLP